MKIPKDESSFGAVCLKPVWVLAIAVFALWLGTASPVWAEITHGELYTFTGAAAWDELGWSVSGAGDVNNDGYADLIVGAHYNNAGGIDAGRAYVYSGQTGGLLYTFTGEAAYDEFGYSVSGAGDVNNDGYADLIVGAPFNGAGGDAAGRAYVYSGQTGALLYTFTGAAVDDRFGASVSGAGDVNNDGYADLIVGAYYNDAGGTNAGRADVYSGQTGTLLYRFTGTAAGDRFGRSVSGAGDVNNDGYDDLIVGADYNDAGGTDAGRAYVYSGQTGGLLYTFTGAATYDYFGFSVSGAGDVNNDGYADLIVGAIYNDAGGTYAGRAYVYSGQTGALLYTFTGAAAYDNFGISVSGAGDVNNDGYADLIVGALYNNAGGFAAGRAYVYSGQTGALLYTFTGEAADDNFGISVSGAGDVNNDGYADLIVGAPLNNAGGPFVGRAYVFSSQELCSYEEFHAFTGEAEGDLFGYSVSGAGDVNNDGYADLIVGAPYNGAGGTSAGRAYVYSGHTRALLYTFTGEAAGNQFGYSVSGAGDVNNDGYADLIVGAPGNDAGGTDAGRAYVYSGQTGALLYTFTGEAAYDDFGGSVSGAVDVNNDGYADLIVGAWYNDAGGAEAGRAYVYSGQTGALLYTFTGEAAGDLFGTSVSGAGDVNNDGYADLIVGAPYNGAGGTEAGRAYVYSGLTAALLYTFTGEAAGNAFGASVSGAGDVNNDGYAELIVGAPFHDAGGTAAGRAYVYSCTPPYLCGDANADVKVTVSDVVYLINYLFKGGPAPLCPPAPYLTCGDANGDGKVTVSDVVYLINYLFKGGPPPVC